MLANLVKSERSVDVQAETVGGALEALFAFHPELRVHIYDEKREIRQHVTCFHNNAIVRDGGMDWPVADGDTVTILQAVSGGSNAFLSI